MAGTGGESFIPLKVVCLTLPPSYAGCGVRPLPLLGAWLFRPPPIAPWCGGGGGQRSLFALVSLILIRYCTRRRYTSFVCHNKYLSLPQVLGDIHGVFAPHVVGALLVA